LNLKKTQTRSKLVQINRFRFWFSYFRTKTSFFRFDSVLFGLVFFSVWLGFFLVFFGLGSVWFYAYKTKTEPNQSVFFLNSNWFNRFFSRFGFFSFFFWFSRFNQFFSCFTHPYPSLVLVMSCYPQHDIFQRSFLNLQCILLFILNIFFICHWI
jgi:hypothetical protein